MRCPFLLLLASVITLGQASAALPLEIVALGLPTDKSKPPKPVLADAGTSASPEVKITPEFVSSSKLSAPTQLWKFKLKVADFPAAETQSRVFVVSNVAGKTFSWSVKAAPEWK